MSQVPDAWDDEWSTSVDTTVSATTDTKKLTTKQTKAQKRAAQAEFNRQIWAEAEGPRETNYFLESRNVVPHRQEFKAAPVLLSRKGPIVQRPRPVSEDAAGSLSIMTKEESSEDEDEASAKQRALEVAKIQAAKDREEKQRKYEERRLELFGPDASSSNSARPTSHSGGSTPANLTPPGSRSSTPHRGGKRGRGRGNVQNHNVNRGQQQLQQHQQQFREVYDSTYAAKPGSTYLTRREQGLDSPTKIGQPVREPKAPDGSPGFSIKRRSMIGDYSPAVDPNGSQAL